jgi:hypothetical protein
MVAEQDDIGPKLIQEVQTRVDVWGDWFRAVSVDATSTGSEGSRVDEIPKVNRQVRFPAFLELKDSLERGGICELCMTAPHGHKP